MWHKSIRALQRWFFECELMEPDTTQSTDFKHTHTSLHKDQSRWNHSYPFCAFAIAYESIMYVEAKSHRSAMEWEVDVGVGIERVFGVVEFNSSMHLNVWAPFEMWNTKLSTKLILIEWYLARITQWQWRGNLCKWSENSHFAHTRRARLVVVVVVSGSNCSNSQTTRDDTKTHLD